MTKNEFKQGDKVATTKCYDISINGYSTTIPIGEVGVIEDIDDDELYVAFSGYGVYLTLLVSDVEPIHRLDRRTAFLSRLQSLMREFNAEMHFSTNSSNFEIYFCDGYKVVDSIFYPLKFPEFYEDEDDYIGNLFLDADNIMEFEKA